MVTSVQKRNIVGRWFQETSQNCFVMEQRDVIKLKSILRLDKNLNNFFVLNKHDIENANYFIDDNIKNILLKEVESLVN